MITKKQIIDQGHQLGFEDLGFTSAAPFDDHKRLLEERADAYDWADGVGLDLKNGVAAKAKDFDLTRLLHMDIAYFESKIWPHMFYMGSDTIWKWKMNVARVMGNSRDERYLPDLERAFNETKDERIKGMAAWAMGQIGDRQTKFLLNALAKNHTGQVLEEIMLAVQSIEKKTRF